MININGKNEYKNRTPQADKLLKFDGSVLTNSGEIILPPDEKRAKEYKTMSAQVAKWLLPDGTETDMLPTGNGGGEISKAYVDSHDTETLNAATNYTDNQIALIPEPQKGDKGDPGAGLPTGGTAGQIPVKATPTNYDTAWKSLELKNQITGTMKLDGTISASLLQPLVTDCNLQITPILGYVGSGSVNLPPGLVNPWGEFKCMRVNPNDDSVMLQTFRHYSTGIEYTRHMLARTWQPWKVTGSIPLGGTFIWKRPLVTGQTDLNTIIEQGEYEFYNSPAEIALTNGAGLIHVHLKVYKYNDNYIRQQMLDVMSNKVFYRCNLNGTWQSWQQVTMV